MVINSIIIENVKGVHRLSINQCVQPNKPNIFIAPNGFGKSSIATAFKSLKNSKLDLILEDYPDENLTLQPKLTITLSTGEELSASKTHNTIKDKFNIFVINSQLFPKAIPQRFGRAITAKASMNIEPTVVYKTIPNRVDFGYNYFAMKRAFGTNGKVLPNISCLFEHMGFLEKLEKKVNFHFLTLKTFTNSIDEKIRAINVLTRLNTDEIRKYIKDNIDLKIDREDFAKLIDCIKTELGYDNDVDAFLAAWQFITVKKKLRGQFNKAIDYARYKQNKDQLDVTLANVNPVKDRIKISTKVHKNSLIIEWPKAHLISNGQRDIMVFIAKLMECRYQSNAKPSILIIDEFFDYLDDANVVAFQYYISSLIDFVKRDKRIIFPILLTHLDPNYLNHFCFNDKRLNLCYLKEVNCKINKELIRFIIKREEIEIKRELDSYFFHYNPYSDTIDITEKLKRLSLNSDWGTPNAFRKKIDRECRTYLWEPDNKFDPIAVCISVRLRIEELVYNLLKTEEKRTVFLCIHGTKEKLNFAYDCGTNFSETYHLLGVIYNHPLHIKGVADISKPLGMKLENPVVKNMIKSLWQ